MEFKLINPQSENGFIQNIDFNFEELKSELQTVLEKYKNLVYDEHSIKLAKADRAKLNKFKDAIETRRKDIKKLCLKPYNDFEIKVKELTGLVDVPINEIGTQLKAFENKRIEQKKEDIQKYYNSVIGDRKELIPLEKIYNPKWENSTFTMTNIESEIRVSIDNVRICLNTIENLNLENDIELATKAKFLETFDFHIAMEEKDKLQNLKLQALKSNENKKDDTLYLNNNKSVLMATRGTTDETFKKTSQQEKTYNRKFWVEGTKLQLLGLASYLSENGIKYGGIE